VTAWAALAAGTVLLVWSAWAYHVLHRPYAGWEGGEVEIVLAPGLDAGSMLARLAEAGVVRHPRLLRAWLAWRGRAGRLHAGEYRFDRPLSPLEVLGVLERGEVLLHPVTVPEGFNLAEVAARLAQSGFGTTEEFIEAFGNAGPIADLDPEAPDLEGYLFPDTYNFPRGERPARIAEAMVRRFREVIGGDYAAQAERLGLGLRSAVTLASLIEKETALAEERGRVSRVFHNRLRRGMKLECDPTVIYALQRMGRTVNRLSYEDLKLDSPWNTYVVQGLPPGPIANPGRESLRASVAPTEGDELYFVASPDGGHRFSNNLPDHLKAVAEWRRYVRSSK
jgi:UPF0755 protein